MLAIRYNNRVLEEFDKNKKEFISIWEIFKWQVVDELREAINNNQTVYMWSSTDDEFIKAKWEELLIYKDWTLKKTTK